MLAWFALACASEPYAALLDGDWDGSATDDDGTVHDLLASFTFDADADFALTGQAALDGGFILPVYAASSDTDSAAVELSNQQSVLSLDAIVVEDGRMKGAFSWKGCDDPTCEFSGKFAADRQ